nr:TlpA disulfide reductase family protein [Spirosoma utsteinense]
MVIKRQGDSFVYHFAQYGVASLQVGDETYKLFISSGFNRPDFEKTTLIEATSYLKSGKIDPQQLVEIGETIRIGDTQYTNKGVDRYHNWLALEGARLPSTDPYSLQTGGRFEPFVAFNFVTGKPISTVHLKGRYIYIDFWGTWCKGCIEELPQLEQLYKGLDHQRVEFISIACHDSADRLRQFLSHHPLTWPQVLSDQTNQLVERYKVNGFPSSVLVDPAGRIVARNLHGSALANKLKTINQN